MASNNVYCDENFDFEAGDTTWPKGNATVDPNATVGGHAMEGVWVSPSTFDGPGKPGGNQNNHNDNYSIKPAGDATWGSWRGQITLLPTDTLGASQGVGGARIACYLQNHDFQSLGDDYYRAIQIQFSPTQDYTAGSVRTWEMHDYPDTDFYGGATCHAIDAQEDILIPDGDWYNQFPVGTNLTINTGPGGTRPHAFNEFTARPNTIFLWTYGMCYGDGTPNGLVIDLNDTQLSNPARPAAFTLRQFPLKPMVRGEIAKFIVRIKMAEDQKTNNVFDGRVQVWLDTVSGANPTPDAATFAAAPVMDYTGPTMKWITGSNAPVARHGTGDSARVDSLTGIHSDMFGVVGLYRGTVKSGGPQVAVFGGVRRRRSLAAAITAFGTGTTPPSPTANTSVPTISGTKTQGQTLTGADGTWTGSPAPTVSGRRWLRCDQNGANAVAISGATATTYVLTTNDIGSTIRFEVTETNTGGTVTAQSIATTVVAAAGASTTPSTGTAVQTTTSGATSATVTVTTGQNDRAVIAFVSDAYPSAVSGITCDGNAMTLAQPDANLDSGSGLTVYKITGQRVGTLPVVATFTSGRTAILTAIPIRDCDSTSVIGVVTTNGAYGASRTITCASTSGDLVMLLATIRHGSASNGTPTQGSLQTQVALSEVNNSSGYTAGLAATKTAVGATTTMTLTLAPTPSSGSTFAAFAIKQAVNQAPPVNTVAPSVTGTSTAGQTLSCDTGTWANTDGSTTYMYQWFRDLIGFPILSGPITGATSSSYTIAASDVGYSIRCSVTATTTAGAITQSSNSTAPVAAAASGQAPTNSVIPAITGTATSGNQLTASTGTWLHTPTAFTYQWWRDAFAIIGATGNAYTLTDIDVGGAITVVVTGANATGSAAATSNATAAVAGIAPGSTAVPVITGSPTNGQTLTASTGTWTHLPTSYTYQWKRDTAGNGTFGNIGSATATTYVLTGSDVGNAIQVAVTATNSTGSTAASSGATGLIAVSSGHNILTGRLVTGSRTAAPRTVGGTGGI